MFYTFISYNSKINIFAKIFTVRLNRAINIERRKNMKTDSEWRLEYENVTAKLKSLQSNCICGEANVAGETAIDLRNTIEKLTLDTKRMELSLKEKDVLLAEMILRIRKQKEQLLEKQNNDEITEKLQSATAAILKRNSLVNVPIQADVNKRDRKLYSITRFSKTHYKHDEYVYENKESNDKAHRGIHKNEKRRYNRSKRSHYEKQRPKTANIVRSKTSRGDIDTIERERKIQRDKTTGICRAGACRRGTRTPTTAWPRRVQRTRPPRAGCLRFAAYVQL